MQGAGGLYLHRGFVDHICVRRWFVRVCVCVRVVSVNFGLAECICVYVFVCVCVCGAWCVCVLIHAQVADAYVPHPGACAVATPQAAAGDITREVVCAVPLTVCVCVFVWIALCSFGFLCVNR